MSDDRPAFQGATSVKLDDTVYYTDSHNHDYGFDEVRVFSDPRWKESELSGDEWRWSHKAQALRKGIVLSAKGGLNPLDALIALLPDLNRIHGWGFLSVDECAQPGCANEPDILMRVKRQWSRSGTLSSDRPNHVRAFCRDHIHRGDCGLDDNDQNYERIGMRIEGEWVPYVGIESEVG